MGNISISISMSISISISISISCINSLVPIVLLVLQVLLVMRGSASQVHYAIIIHGNTV